MNNNIMNKIIVIGTTGSGKSTFAKRLSQHLNYPYIQLDKLYWKANWIGSSDEEFLQRVKDSLQTEQWIIDGNYTKTNELTWSQADTIIWLDLPFYLTFYQCFMRSLIRSIRREELWEGTGNKESIWKMLSRDSILLWLFKTYKPNRAKYESRMSDPLYSHVKFHRLRSRKEIASFLNKEKPTLMISGL